MPLPRRNYIKVPSRLDLSSGLNVCRNIVQLNDLVFRRETVLDFTKVSSFFPNGIVPIVNLVTKLREQGAPFSIEEPEGRAALNAFRQNCWGNALDSSIPLPPNDPTRTNRLREFKTTYELDPLVNRILDLCLTSTTLPKGVIETLEWALNETAGNILDHSDRESGSVQMMYYPLTKHFAFIVADCGIGIANSMRTRFNEPATDISLIERAMIRGITSKPGRNQGFGLAGVFSIAAMAGGICNIISNNGHLAISNGNVTRRNLDWPYPGTIVEVQFDADKPVDPKLIIGYERENYFNLRFESPDAPQYKIRICEYNKNFGNRPAGLRVRNLVKNLLTENPGHCILLDFDEVRTVSSSWADEAIGLLLCELGTSNFFTKIRITGQNEFCHSVIDVAIQKRLG
jgi:hypothetical protein